MTRLEFAVEEEAEKKSFVGFVAEEVERSLKKVDGRDWMAQIYALYAF